MPLPRCGRTRGRRVDRIAELAPNRQRRLACDAPHSVGGVEANTTRALANVSIVNCAQ